MITFRDLSATFFVPESGLKPDPDPDPGKFENRIRIQRNLKTGSGSREIWNWSRSMQKHRIRPDPDPQPCLSHLQQGSAIYTSWLGVWGLSIHLFLGGPPTERPPILTVIPTDLEKTMSSLVSFYSCRFAFFCLPSVLWFLSIFMNWERFLKTIFIYSILMFPCAQVTLGLLCHLDSFVCFASIGQSGV